MLMSRNVLTGGRAVQCLLLQVLLSLCASLILLRQFISIEYSNISTAVLFELYAVVAFYCGVLLAAMLKVLNGIWFFLLI